MDHSQFNAEESIGNLYVEELEAAKFTEDQLRYISANFGIQFTH